MIMSLLQVTIWEVGSHNQYPYLALGPYKRKIHFLNFGSNFSRRSLCKRTDVSQANVFRWSQCRDFPIQSSFPTLKALGLLRENLLHGQQSAQLMPRTLGSDLCAVKSTQPKLGCSIHPFHNAVLN